MLNVINRNATMRNTRTGCKTRSVKVKLDPNGRFIAASSTTIHGAYPYESTNIESNSHIGLRILAARQRYNLSRESLSAMVTDRSLSPATHVSASLLRAYERGLCSPKIDRAKVINEVLLHLSQHESNKCNNNEQNVFTLQHGNITMKI